LATQRFVAFSVGVTISKKTLDPQTVTEKRIVYSKTEECVSTLLVTMKKFTSFARQTYVHKKFPQGSVIIG
jgi:hypothetical protein